jgi:K+-sensing histidine kinase KdpD
VKNTRAGYIKIGYYLHEEKIVFYVLDSGKDFLKYREFLQTDDLNKTLKNQEDTSTAINLSLARKLIQILGGSIWSESNGIAGAGVYFSIPVKVKVITELSLKRINKTRIEI